MPQFSEKPIAFNEALLMPGRSSMEGFLTNGQTLEKVMKRDNLALGSMGYSAQEVADLLGAAMAKVMGGGRYEHTAVNGKVFDVEVRSYRGSQECPWGDPVDYRRSSGGIDLFFTERGKQGKPVRIPGLMRHLIEAHGFFEGGAYRVAPETIVEMFGVEKIPGSIDKAKQLSL